MSTRDVFAELADLVDRKQQAYGRAFDTTADVMRLLYPRGVRVDQLDEVPFVTRIVEKLTRITRGEGAFALGEDAWSDIAGISGIRVDQLRSRASHGEQS
jgi:hypothetical protein